MLCINGLSCRHMEGKYLFSTSSFEEEDLLTKTSMYTYGRVRYMHEYIMANCSKDRLQLPK